MNSLRYLIILILLIIPLQVFSAEILQEPITPLPTVSRDLVRLGEGTAYCYAGYGTQQLSFDIEGRSVHGNAVSNPHLPAFDGTASTSLQFGCKTDLLFLEFSTVDDSMKLSKNVSYQDKTYNTIRYQYRILAIGHSISVLPHRLYLDLGLGYGILDYTLGLYGSQYVSDTTDSDSEDESDTADSESQYESDTTSSGNIMLRAGLRVIINHYVMIHWQVDTSIRKDDMVEYSGQIGLNFISRF